MDERTLAAYDADSQKYCRDWQSQNPPEEIHASARRYFVTGGETADIGCGCGRDVDWLNRQGWPCIGYEPSSGLRAEAHRLYPSYRFLADPLPLLVCILHHRFDNVLCETVLIHLPHNEQAAALDALLRILRPGGVPRLSWRAGKDGARRDAPGRLYEPVDGGTMKKRLEARGCHPAARGISARFIRCHAPSHHRAKAWILSRTRAVQPISTESDAGPHSQVFLRPHGPLAKPRQ